MPFTINDDDRKPAPNQAPAGGGGNISARPFNISEDDKKEAPSNGEVQPTPEQQKYKAGDTYTAKYDGQTYNVIDAGGSLLLQSPSGTMAHSPNTPNTCLLYTSDAADE